MRAVVGSLGRSPGDRKKKLEGPRWTPAVESTQATLPCFTCKKTACYSPMLVAHIDCVRSALSHCIFHEAKMPEVPVKIYLDKLLKECGKVARKLALLSGPVKEKALRAMANRLAADEDRILAANEKDVDAVGMSFEADVMKDRMKAAVARLRMTTDDIKEMVDRQIGRASCRERA